MTTIRIASRGSKLALWQAEYVKSLLMEHGFLAKIHIIKTKGDKVQNRFLHEIGGKGLFVRELEQSMLDGETDLGIHSLKDLPANLPEPFDLPAILQRHSSRDVLIFRKEVFERLSLKKEKLITPEDLANMGALTIGTASLRRQSMIKSIETKITLKPLRGNVDTRLAKLHSGQFDAIILAEAALDRLELTDELYYPLDPSWFVPSPAQGALAIECLKSHPLRDALSKMNCMDTMQAVTTERLVLAKLGGDCTMPIGCHLSVLDNKVISRVKVLNYDGINCTDEWSHNENIRNIDPDQVSDGILSRMKANNLTPILEDLKKEPPNLGEL